MPSVRSKKSGAGTKKKKKSLFGRFKDAGNYVLDAQLRFNQGAEDAVTGFPSGVVAIAHALDQALPASPIPNVDEGHVRDAGPLKGIGKNIVVQTKDSIRHPMRDPFSTLTTLAGVAAPVVGAPARASAGVSAASRATGVGGKVKAAAKGAAKPKPATRKVKLIDKQAKAETKTYKVKTKDGTKTTKQTVYKKTGPKEVTVEANPNPLVRGLRKVTLDPIYERSRKAASADPDNPKAGRYARNIERRTMDQRERYAENLRNAMNPPGPVKVPDNPVRNITRAPMDLMRLGMYARPRYYVQNLGGTAQLLAHAGVSLGDVRAVQKIAKSDPELYKLMRAAGGETGTKAIANVSTGGGKLGRASKWASEKANVPESHMRTVGIWKAAKDYGITTPDELKAVLKRPDSDEAQLIMARGNEMLVDYGRIGGSGAIGKAEKQFVQSGLPIFYPMMKGFTRYGARFPTQHPVQTAGITQVGQMGKEFQRENLGGEPQPWFPYITPLKDGKTQNLQNIYAFSPGADVMRQAAQALPGGERHETLNLLQALGPSAELGYGALTGRQLATGFEYDTDDLDRFGSAGAALKDTAQSVVPGLEYLFPRSSAAYGEPSLTDRLGLAAVGPGLYPRKTDYGKVIQPKKKRKGRRKKPSKF